MIEVSGGHTKKILLAVSGMSPQIITETLFALVTAKSPWVPDEIHLLTTVEGRQRAVLQLLEGKKHFLQLLKDYKIKHPIQLDASTIHVICDAKGQQMHDLRTPADNEAAADCISDKIRELTADPHTELHVSLAGGRKTMGFYAGYALSLFGRPQDRLSHVLVSSEYESLPDFFYPTHKTQVIHDRNDKPLDASKAEVWLAEIPFVRMRGGLPENLLNGNKSFSETIELARKATEKPRLMLEPKYNRIILNGMEAKLQPSHMLLLLWAAWRKQNNREPIQTLVEGEKNHEYAKELFNITEHYWLEINGKTRSGLEKDGVTKMFLETNISRLNTSLREELGAELAFLCKLAVMKNGHGSGYALPGNLDIVIQ
jgi:CRISPR-associated protein (TIGR02584 family)